MCVYLAQYATIHQCKLLYSILWHCRIIKAKEWKCEKHSQQRQQQGKPKLCYKISNANNSIVSNGCFYERLNQIKPNLIDLWCAGIVRMKGYQIKLTENKMRPISDRFDRMANSYVTNVCFSHRKLDVPFSLGQSSSWIYLYVNLSISFGCSLDVVGFSFSFFLSHKNQRLFDCKGRAPNHFLLYEYVRKTSSHQMASQDTKRMGGKSPNFLFHFTCHIIIPQHYVCCCFFWGWSQKEKNSKNFSFIISMTFQPVYKWIFRVWKTFPKWIFSRPEKKTLLSQKSSAQTQFMAAF